jgi:hypothetical protein
LGEEKEWRSRCGGRGVELTVGQWNCEGIKRVLEHAPITDFERADCWVLTETFARDPFDVPGFYSYHALSSSAAGPGRPVGGVSVLMNSKFREIVVRLRETNAIVVESDQMVIIAGYSSPTEDLADFVEKMIRILSVNDSSKVCIVAGDFNCRIDTPEDTERTTALKNILREFGYWLVSKPRPYTYNSKGSSTIDIYATNGKVGEIADVNLVEGDVIPFFRKHAPIALKVMTMGEDTEPTRTERLRREIDTEKLIKKLQALDRDVWWAEGDVNIKAKLLSKVMIESVLPAGRVDRKSKPWFNSECYQRKAEVGEAKILFNRNMIDSEAFMQVKKRYRRVIEREKKKWDEREDYRLLESAIAKPHTYKKRTKGKAACPISSENLVQHFQGIARGVSTILDAPPVHEFVHAERQRELLERANDDFTLEEVREGIKKLKENKAEGCDRIRNEHLRNGSEAVSHWTQLFNDCLEDGEIPEDWRTCLMTLIPKGKGALDDPASWRGISKKAVPGKLLAALVANRLRRYLEGSGEIPEEQHGFVRGRSTESAVKVLLDFTREVLREKGASVYAVFIDFRAAFDNASRKEILEKLAGVGLRGRLMTLLCAMLAENSVILNDGVRDHPPYRQRTGLPQGDTISGLLFVVLLMHLPAELRGLFLTIIIALYADDLVLLSRSLDQLQRALNATKEICLKLGLEINKGKTKAMKFRRGGRLAASDILSLDNEGVEFVGSFCYLGFLISTSTTSYSRHIAFRRTKCLMALSEIPDLRRLPLETAMALFRIKLSTCADYGIRVIWDRLSTANMMVLDSVKSSFLKKCLGLSKYARSRHAYMLADTSTLVEELVRKYDLPWTPAYGKFLEQWEGKFAEIEQEFYNTEAMRSESWKGADIRNRHLKCRYAEHGFHYKLCQRKNFHEPDHECLCDYCGESCKKYHFEVCGRPQFASLRELAEDLEQEQDT